MRNYNLFLDLRDQFMNNMYDLFDVKLTSPGFRSTKLDDKLQYELDLPGLKASDVQLSVTGNNVFVSGTSRGEKFKYSFYVETDYDVANPDASMDAGVLTLTFKPLTRDGPKLIAIKEK